MTYIILDLEWNGAYARRTKGYFNEIIEIGAVKISDALEEVDTFHAVIKPVVSRKLSTIVQNLTGIGEEELEEGQPFSRAVSQLRKWIDDPNAVVMTWSTTDLMVLIENCRYFLHEEQIPFMNYYADLQAYCQSRIGYDASQQIGLGKACELLEIGYDDFSMHRALDDSILSGKVFVKLFQRLSFDQTVKIADNEFYSRLTFKTVIINDIQSEYVNKADLRFRCDTCNRQLKRTSEWRFRNRSFTSVFFCRSCDRSFEARVQVKLKYDGAETSRKLIYKPPAEQTENENEANDLTRESAD